MTTTIVWNVAQLERHTADGIVMTVHYTNAGKIRDDGSRNQVSG